MYRARVCGFILPFCGWYPLVIYYMQYAFLGFVLVKSIYKEEKAEKARNQEQERAGKQIEKISYIYSYT